MPSRIVFQEALRTDARDSATWFDVQVDSSVEFEYINIICNIVYLSDDKRQQGTIVCKGTLHSPMAWVVTILLSAAFDYTVCVVANTAGSLIKVGYLCSNDSEAEKPDISRGARIKDVTTRVLSKKAEIKGECLKALGSCLQRLVPKLPKS